MKILHLSNYFAPVGGIETYIIDLLPLLEEQGIENVLIHRKEHPNTSKSIQSRVVLVPAEDPIEFQKKSIEEIVQLEKPDLIYLHDVYDPDLMDFIRRKAPTVGYVHIFFPVCPGLGKLFRKGDQICPRPYGLGCVPMIYLRNCSSARQPISVFQIMQTTKKYLRVYKLLDKIVVASRYMKDLLIINGISEDKIEILPYFVPIPEIINQVNDQPKIQRAKILFAGRLEYEKGLPYLLRAVADLHISNQLIVAGDGSLKQNYIKMAQDLGLSDNVKFLDWLSASALEKLYSDCTISVMPSIMPEPFGKVGVESMANGRPVIAFDVGGIPDWLIDGFNGYLVPSRNIPLLSQKIGNLLSDQEVLNKFGNNGRKYVEEKYSTNIHIQGLLRIFSSVINKIN